ncbi:MAG: hypothetical protein FWE82_04885 [Defluviitaleaceae bacterium]|nr:hypothetical protein [Defluviitaleaceae bacterium]
MKKKKKKTSAYEMHTVFRRFIDDMHPADPLYPSVRQTAQLCDEALKSAKSRIKLNGKIHALNGRMAELESYNSLSEKDANEIKNLLDSYLAVSEERSQLHEQLTEFDPTLAKMFKLEEDASAAMANMKDAERYQQVLKQDLSYIDSEKEELAFDREGMATGLTFIHYFSVGMVALFAVTAAVLAFFFIVSGENIFWPTAIFVVLAALIIGLLYSFRKKLQRDIRVNTKKQKRAVALLNKKNVVYAYYTNYLRYTYRKYKVRNTQMLANHLEDFGKYKALLKRIDLLRKLRYETEDTIEKFLREKKLTGIKSTIEGFARTVKLEDKRRYYSEMKDERAAVERQLVELEATHEELWDVLNVLSERDTSEDKLIDKIIQAYLDEAARAFSRAGIDGGAKKEKEDGDGIGADDEEDDGGEDLSF